MKINEIAEILGAHIVSLYEPEREITSGYAGDLLSFVMGRAPENCAWFTVMNNANVAAVALLADISVIVICEGVLPDENLEKKAKSQKVNLLTTNLSVFDAIKKFASQLK